MNDSVISVEGVSKSFRLYHERNQSLKSRAHAAAAASATTILGPQGRVLRGPAGHDVRPGRPQRLGQEHDAQVHRPHPPAEQGKISVDGRMSALLELGAGFHPELSGRENVYLNGSILGMTKREIEQKFDEIVGFAGLERFIDMPVKNYSSGMYVRLGFSVAINVDPDILLVDEVLAVGDEEFQRKCLERVADLREAGKTIVVVTHALGTVRNLCDEAIWLENGVMRDRARGRHRRRLPRPGPRRPRGGRVGPRHPLGLGRHPYRRRRPARPQRAGQPSRSGPATRSPSGSTTRRPGRSSGPCSGSACSPSRACR